MEIKDQVIVTFVGIAFGLFFVDQLMDPVPIKVGAQAKTVSVVETKVHATVESKHVKSKTAATATANVSPTFSKEGLTRVDEHAHGATAFYFEGSPAVKEVKPNTQHAGEAHKAAAKPAAVTSDATSFYQEGLTRMDEHEHGATAFYFEGSPVTKEHKAESHHVVVANTSDLPPFLQEGLSRVDQHAYGATAFYQ